MQLLASFLSSHSQPFGPAKTNPLQWEGYSLLCWLVRWPLWPFFSCGGPRAFGSDCSSPWGERHAACHVLTQFFFPQGLGISLLKIPPPPPPPPLKINVYNKHCSCTQYTQCCTHSLACMQLFSVLPNSSGLPLPPPSAAQEETWPSLLHTTPLPTR